MREKITIKKNHFRPCGSVAALQFCGRLKSDVLRTQKISFNENCVYDLKNEHQASWCKLMGFCLGVFGIHKNSFRFGWRYNTDLHKIEIAILQYHKGEVLRKKIWSCDLNTENEYTIYYDRDKNCVMYFINDTRIFYFELDKIKERYYFGCGFYFGGQKPAPHDVSINCEEV